MNGPFGHMIDSTNQDVQTIQLLQSQRQSQSPMHAHCPANMARELPTAAFHSSSCMGPTCSLTRTARQAKAQQLEEELGSAGARIPVLEEQVASLESDLLAGLEPLDNEVRAHTFKMCPQSRCQTTVCVILESTSSSLAALPMLPHQQLTFHWTMFLFILLLHFAQFEASSVHKSHSF